MSDYTPNTLQVRTSACWSAKLDPDEFDRWLAEHDAEVARATEERILETLRAEAHRLDSSETRHYRAGLQRAHKLIKGENE